MYEYVEMIDRETRLPVLIKERKLEYGCTEGMNNPEKIHDFMNEVFCMNKLAQERLYMIAMNSHCDICGVFLISKGSTDQACYAPAELFQKAMLTGAHCMVLVHNHPSGWPEPSGADKKSTSEAAAFGNSLGIKLHDHVIIGKDGYFSMRESMPDLFDYKVVFNPC